MAMIPHFICKELEGKKMDEANNTEKSHTEGPCDLGVGVLSAYAWYSQVFSHSCCLRCFWM